MQDFVCETRSVKKKNISLDGLWFLKDVATVNEWRWISPNLPFQLSRASRIV